MTAAHCGSAARRGLSASRQRASEQLSALPRSRAAAGQARRPRRPDPAVRHRDRSRQRGAAPPPVRSHVDRYVDRLRQPRAHFPDPPQRAVRRAGRRPTAARPRRCGFAAALPISTSSIARIATRAAGVVAVARSSRGVPEHLTIPEVTTAAALGILTTSPIAFRRSAIAPGWHARFGRELNATDDRPRFVPLDRRARVILPIVEGKQLSPFQVDLALESGIPITTAARLLDRRRPSRARIAYRDVASATNKLTLIAAMLPRDVISTHTVFCLKTDLDEDAVVPARTAEQPGRELPGAPERDDARHRGADVAPAGAAAARDSREFDRLVDACRSARRDRHRRETHADYAELNAIAAGLYGDHNRPVRVHPRFIPVSAETLRAMPCPIIRARSHGSTEARKLDQGQMLHEDTHRQDPSVRDRGSSRRSVPACAEHSYQAAMAIEMTASGLALRARAADSQSRYRGVDRRLASTRFRRRRMRRRRTEGRVTRIDPVFTTAGADLFEGSRGLRVGLLINFNVDAIDNSGSSVL